MVHLGNTMIATITHRKEKQYPSPIIHFRLSDRQHQQQQSERLAVKLLPEESHAPLLMGLYSLKTNPQSIGDFLILLTLNIQEEHFPATRRQFIDRLEKHTICPFHEKRLLIVVGVISRVAVSDLLNKETPPN